jgi:hypothetical protein
MLKPLYQPPNFTNAAVTQVLPSEYPQTATAQSKSFSDLKFSNNVSTNRDNSKCVKILPAECSILSLVDGSRRKPIYSDDSVFGYTQTRSKRLIA